MRDLLLFIGTVISGFHGLNAIKCYQCSSDEKTATKGMPYCGVWGDFDSSRHELVDCNGVEAHTPGIFCLKEVRESPGIWGPWKSVIRRCAAKSVRGVSGSCEQTITSTGIQIHACSCNKDGCNGSSQVQMLPKFLFIFSVIIFYFFNR